MFPQIEIQMCITDSLKININSKILDLNEYREIKRISDCKTIYVLTVLGEHIRRIVKYGLSVFQKLYETPSRF